MGAEVVAEPTVRVQSARRAWLQALVLALASLLAHLPALRADFHWDDELFLHELPFMAADDGLARIWFTPEAPDYWPLSYSALWLERRLFGMDPTGYHAVNLVGHALAVLLLWRLLVRLRIPGAWLAALLFGVHPVNVECVSWSYELKTMLAQVFLVGAHLLYLRHEERGGAGTLGAALLLFVLAVLAKATVVMLGPVLLLTAWWRHGRIRGPDLGRAAPFWLAALVLGLVNVWFQYRFSGGAVPARPEGLASRLAASGWVFGFYLRKALWPTDLIPIYPRWDVDETDPVAWVPLLALVAVAVFLWTKRRGWGRHVLFGLGYFALMLWPVLGFFDMTIAVHSLVADHFEYPALIGVLALVGAGVQQAWKRWSGARVPIAIGATLVVATLGTLTWRQSRLYESPEALWSKAIAVNDQAWGAYSWRGTLRAREGRYEEAREDFERAAELQPNHADAHYDLGLAHVALGKYRRAVRDFDRALELAPDHPRARYERGMARLNRGEVREALADFEGVLERQPTHARAHDGRGMCLELLGDPVAAERAYSEAIRINPAPTRAFANRARLALQRGDVEQARADVRAGLTVGHPIDVELLQAVGMAPLSERP